MLFISCEYNVTKNKRKLSDKTQTKKIDGTQFCRSRLVHSNKIITNTCQGLQMFKNIK